MNRLNQSMLTEEDYEYIEHEQDMWQEVARLEQEYYEEGRKEGLREGWQEGKQEGKREGWQEGKREGQKEGRKEGEQNKAVEIARNLLELGLDSTQITQATGLSPADLASLTVES